MKPYFTLPDSPCCPGGKLTLHERDPFLLPAVRPYGTTHFVVQYIDDRMWKGWCYNPVGTDWIAFGSNSFNPKEMLGEFNGDFDPRNIDRSVWDNWDDATFATFEEAVAAGHAAYPGQEYRAPHVE